MPEAEALPEPTPESGGQNNPVQDRASQGQLASEIGKTFSPIEAIERLLKLNKIAATIIIAGLALAAAIVILRIWDVDPNVLFPTVIFFLVPALILIVMANVLQNPSQKQILGWLLVTLTTATTIVLFVSAVFPNQKIFAPLPCLLRLATPCEQVFAQLAETNNKAKSQSANTESTPSYRNYKVYIQFAGSSLPRDAIIGLSKFLQNMGWDIQGEKGDYQENADGLNQVRYRGPEDKAAAQALATAINDADITSASVEPKQLSIIAPKTLEVWISK